MKGPARPCFYQPRQAQGAGYFHYNTRTQSGSNCNVNAGDAACDNIVDDSGHCDDNHAIYIFQAPGTPTRHPTSSSPTAAPTKLEPWPKLQQLCASRKYLTYVNVYITCILYL